MARAIPDVPIDGEQYASLGLAGLPQVLEYDAPTGGYKLVVSTEAGVAINISGTVEVTGGQLTLVGGGQYGEDTPHCIGVSTSEPVHCARVVIEEHRVGNSLWEYSCGHTIC